MTLQLQMIGTGSAFAKKYYNNNALIRLNGYNLLIDCGITAPMALHRMGLPMDEIDGVLVTHLHGDHIGGLEELAFQLQFVYRKRIDLFVPAKLAHPLWEHSLRAGMECEAEGQVSLEDFFHVQLLQEGEAFPLHPDLRVEIRQTEHMPGKISYSLFLNDIFYSADCRFSEPLLREACEVRGVRAILHDCQLESPGFVHATLDELLTLPEEMQRIIWLMHYGDNMEAFIGQTGSMRILQQHQVYEF